MKKIGSITLSERKGLMLEDRFIIADLHLGLEGVLESRGIAIPSLQVERIISEVEGIVAEFNPEELVVAGDLKHEFSRNLPEEWKDVRKFVERISGEVRLRVVRGNHDNFLQSILSKYNIDFEDSVKIGEFYVVHGHRDTDREKLIIGHEHPSIKIRHGGGLYSFRAFLHAVNNEKDVWVIPHFSPVLPGYNVIESGFISPVMSPFSPEDVEVYAIEDGVYFMGTLKILSELM